MENEKKPGVLARLWSALSNRVTTEPKHPETSRVPWTPRTVAGVTINEDNMLTVSAAWASVRYISQGVASGPWHAMRSLPGGGSEIARTHPTERMLHWRVSPEYSSRDFRIQLTSWALRWGNGYAEIVPDMAGRAMEMWPISPDRVEVCRAIDVTYDSYGDEIQPGELYYEVNNGSLGKAYLSAKRIFHIRGMSEGPVGMSVAQYAAQSIGWAKAAALFGAAFFGNGANVSLVVKNKVALTPEALAKQKAEFQTLYSGPRNARKTVHVDADTDITTITTKPADAQFVELNQHLIEDVARWFGAPLHKIGHLLRATNNNIEHQSIEAVQDCLLPWVLKFEEEADYKLFGQNRQNYFSKINLDGLLRGDAKTRAESFRIYKEIGVYSTDEIREKLDENPVGEKRGGNKLTMNGSYQLLEKVGDDVVASPATAASEPDDTEDMENAMLAKLRVAGVPVKQAEEAAIVE